MLRWLVVVCSLLGPAAAGRRRGPKARREASYDEGSDGRYEQDERLETDIEEKEDDDSYSYSYEQASHSLDSRCLGFQIPPRSKYVHARAMLEAAPLA